MPMPVSQSSASRASHHDLKGNKVEFKLRPKRERHACGVPSPFIHHATRVSIAVRINSPPFAGLVPHPIPYPPWPQISTSNLPTYWAALCPSVAAESHKIQAFRPSSRFVPLEHPLSCSCSPFAMGEHFSSVGKRDITSCTHCFIPTSLRVSPKWLFVKIYASTIRNPGP